MIKLLIFKIGVQAPLVGYALDSTTLHKMHTVENTH